jgi:uncharacterized protein
VQFAVIGWDAADDGALERRAKTRPSHMNSIQAHVERGSILVGGALLNDDDQMIGSIIIADFPSRADLDAWIEADPYVTEGVWDRIEVQPFRAAVGTWLT